MSLYKASCSMRMAVPRGTIILLPLTVRLPLQYGFPVCLFQCFLLSIWSSYCPWSAKYCLHIAQKKQSDAMCGVVQERDLFERRKIFATETNSFYHMRDAWFIVYRVCSSFVVHDWRIRTVKQKQCINYAPSRRRFGVRLESCWSQKHWHYSIKKI